jgi:hypothetical protein
MPADSAAMVSGLLTHPVFSIRSLSATLWEWMG